MSRLLLTAAVAVAVVATLPAGGRVFAAAVLLWGGVLLVEVSELAGSGGRRPLVPAVAVAALGPPVGLLAAGEHTWDRMPMLMAWMLLAAFILALVGPRKVDVTVTLGATVLPALLLGFGTGGVLVLRSAGAGFRWTLGVLLLTAGPVVLGAVAEQIAGAAAQTPTRVVSAGAIGGAMLFGANAPFGVVVTLVLTAAGLGAGWAMGALTSALAGTGAADEEQRSRQAALSALAAPLVAAPIAAFLAFATQA